MKTFDYSALRMARISAHIKQADAAKKIGVTSVTLSSWENGFKDIPSSKLSKLMNLYGASPTELFITKPERKIENDKPN